MNTIAKGKPSKRLVILRISMLVLFVAVGFILLRPTSAPKTPEAIFAEAKKTCRDGIWFVQKDAVFYDVMPKATPPYPSSAAEVSGEQLVGFGCSKAEAQKERDNLSNAYDMALLMIIGVPVGFILLLGLFVWWGIEEIRLRERAKSIRR